LEDCLRAGISRFILGGIGPEEWDRQDELALAYPGKFIKVFGLHPWRVDELASKASGASQITRELEKLAVRLAQAGALGETGLDAGRDRFKRSKPAQLAAFETQLDLARERAKPLVLHVVRAHSVALEILARKRASLGLGGLVHSFSGSWADARNYLDLGFTLSVSARITHPDAHDLRETTAKAPAERLVFETDAPDQPPYGCTSKLHTPLSLLKVIDKVSEIRSEAPEVLLDRSRDILKRIFRF
jgi:TatD DNase family protein